jgi:ParB family chromosome partitioning protein
MQTQRISVDDIEIGERNRALSADAVARLTASMNDIGLKSPISIRIADDVMIDGKPCDGVPILVAGAHRLAAAKSLGWTHIDCIEVEDDPITAELWEIAENLHRCDLSKEQRDEHIRRYAELLTERSKRIVPQTAEQMPAPRGRPKSITTQVAEATGLSDDTVRRALNPRPAPRIVNVPDPVNEADVIERQVASLMAAWNRAGAEARERFLIEIDAPVFDQPRAA